MSKSRISLIIASLATIAASIFIYFSQTSQKAAKDIRGSSIKSRVTNFELYKYHGDRLVSRATGVSATLMAQGRLVCDGRMRLVRISDEIRQELEADRAEITFQSESLFGENAGLVDTAIFSGNVDYLRGHSRFQTDLITYSEKAHEASTDKPVRIESDGQFIAAEGGMIYNVKTEALKMRGGVFGAVRTDVIQKGVKGAPDK